MLIDSKVNGYDDINYEVYNSDNSCDFTNEDVKKCCRNSRTNCDDDRSVTKSSRMNYDKQKGKKDRKSNFSFVSVGPININKNMKRFEGNNQEKFRPMNKNKMNNTIYRPNLEVSLARALYRNRYDVFRLKEDDENFLEWDEEILDEDTYQECLKLFYYNPLKYKKTIKKSYGNLVIGMPVVVKNAHLRVISPEGANYYFSDDDISSNLLFSSNQSNTIPQSSVLTTSSDDEGNSQINFCDGVEFNNNDNYSDIEENFATVNNFKQRTSLPTTYCDVWGSFLNLNLAIIRNLNNYNIKKLTDLFVATFSNFKLPKPIEFECKNVLVKSTGNFTFLNFASDYDKYAFYKLRRKLKIFILAVKSSINVSPNDKPYSIKLLSHCRSNSRMKLTISMYKDKSKSRDLKLIESIECDDDYVDLFQNIQHPSLIDKNGSEDNNLTSFINSSADRTGDQLIMDLKNELKDHLNKNNDRNCINKMDKFCSAESVDFNENATDFTITQINSSNNYPLESVVYCSEIRIEMERTRFIDPRFDQWILCRTMPTGSTTESLFARVEFHKSGEKIPVFYEFENPKHKLLQSRFCTMYKVGESIFKFNNLKNTDEIIDQNQSV